MSYRKYLASALLGCLLFGCASLPKGVNPMPECPHQVEGLSCQREQIWQMRSSYDVFYVDNTFYWFKDEKSCQKFIDNPRHKNLLDMSEGGYIHWCGCDGRSDSSADVSTYYVYSDGKGDGKNYYMIDRPFNAEYSEGYSVPQSESFHALFSSRQAMDIFEKDMLKYDNGLNPKKEIKIVRIYSSDDEKNIEVPTSDSLGRKMDKELAEQKDVIKTLKTFKEYFISLPEQKVLSPLQVVAQGDNSRVNNDLKTRASYLSEDLPIDKKCLIGDNRDYFDKSDECVLARRQAKILPTSVGYFNYKKYLPEKSAIHNDDEFLNLLETYVRVLVLNSSGMYDGEYRKKYNRDCEATTELTRSEKMRCVQDKTDFIYQVALGIAPKCRDLVKEKYLAFRRNELQHAINLSAKKNKEFNNQKLREFGYINLCIPDYIQ